MLATSETDAFQRGIGPMLQIVLPGKAEALAVLHPDAGLQERIEELAGKSTEGQLTEEEKAEYAGYVRADKFVAVLRRQVLRWIRTEA